MADYQRSLDDLLLDGLVAKVKAQRDEDVLAIPALNYDAERDRSSPWQDLRRPLVNVELETDTPQGRDYVARYRLACLVPSLDDDETAGKRLAILKEQVRVALLGLDDYDFGQPIGSVSIKARPSWRRVAFDDAELDLTLLAGEWTVEIAYAYKPSALTGPTLSEISITLGERFAALYNLGGN